MRKELIRKISLCLCHFTLSCGSRQLFLKAVAVELKKKSSLRAHRYRLYRNDERYGEHIIFKLSMKSFHLFMARKIHIVSMSLYTNSNFSTSNHMSDKIYFRSRCLFISMRLESSEPVEYLKMTSHSQVIISELYKISHKQCDSIASNSATEILDEFIQNGIAVFPNSSALSITFCQSRTKAAPKESWELN